LYKKRLYFVNKDDKGNDKLFPYLFMCFSKKSHINQLRFLKSINIPGVISNFKCRIHEQDATPVLQLTCIQNVLPVGWIDITGQKVDKYDQESICDYEYIVNWKKIKPSQCMDIVHPLIMSFDIECNSSNPNVMPDCNKPKDKIFQISISLSNFKEDKKFLLTLGNPDKDIVGIDCEIRNFDTEYELLNGYTRFIQEFKP